MPSQGRWRKWRSGGLVAVSYVYFWRGEIPKFSFHLNISEFSIRLQTWNSCEFSRRSINEFAEKGVFEAMVLGWSWNVFYGRHLSRVKNNSLHICHGCFVDDSVIFSGKKPWRGIWTNELLLPIQWSKCLLLLLKCELIGFYFFSE